MQGNSLPSQTLEKAVHGECRFLWIAGLRNVNPVDEGESSVFQQAVAAAVGCALLEVQGAVDLHYARTALADNDNVPLPRSARYENARIWNDRQRLGLW